MGRCSAFRVRGTLLLVGVLLLGLATIAGTATAGTASGAGAAASGAGAAASGAGAAARAKLTIPLDERPHRQPTEWWYFSGHLRGSDSHGHRHVYGFEYVTFQFDNGVRPLYVGNLAVTDLTRGRFRYGAQVDSYPVPRTPGAFDLHTGAWTMSGSNGSDTLHAALTDYDLSMRLRTTKPAVLHGSGGVIPYGPFGSSKYYSWTSLRAGGTVVDHGVPIRVSGVAWMDHQWGPINFAGGGGWDWFSIQLRGNVQYMLYFIRDPHGQIVQSIGTEVAPNGAVTHLPGSAVTEQTRSSWTSHVTGIEYGSSWRVEVPGGRLTVAPKLADQELDLRTVQGVAYWEGAVGVRGHIDGHRVAGVGYTEINPPGTP